MVGSSKGQELCKKMNHILVNVWRREAENYWHDEMNRLRFLLGSAVKTSGDRRGKTSFYFIKEQEHMEFSPVR